MTNTNFASITQEIFAARDLALTKIEAARIEENNLNNAFKIISRERVRLEKLSKLTGDIKQLDSYTDNFYTPAKNGKKVAVNKLKALENTIKVAAGFFDLAPEFDLDELPNIERRFRVGLNHTVVGKIDPDKLSAAKDWSWSDVGTIAQLEAHIKKGHPWMPGLLDSGKRRKKEYTNRAEVLALDFDDNITIEEALSREFIKRYAALIITSSSHTATKHKFRVVFVLDQPIEGKDQIEEYILSLLGFFTDADSICKDASRYFFGAVNAQTHLINDQAVLPLQLLDIGKKGIIQEKRPPASEVKLEVTEKRLQLFQAALRYCPVRSARGSGEYESIRTYVWGLCSAIGVSNAELLLSEHDDHEIIRKLLDDYKDDEKARGRQFWKVAIEYGFDPYIDETANVPEFLETVVAEKPMIAELTVVNKKNKGEFYRVENFVKSLRPTPEQYVKLHNELFPDILFTKNNLVPKTIFKDGVEIDNPDKRVGKPQSEQMTTTLDYYHLVGDNIKFNEMSQAYEVYGEEIDYTNITFNTLALLKYNKLSEQSAISNNHFLGNRNKYSPVVEYFNSIKDIGYSQELVKNIPRIFWGNDNTDENEYFYRKLLACVARAHDPGCKDDILLVLHGKAGYRKSTLINVLAGEYKLTNRIGKEDVRSLFTDNIEIDMDKDNLSNIRKFWILEVSELNSHMNKKDIERFKMFLSRKVDTYRSPYERKTANHKRTSSLIATTNDPNILNDAGGDRRFRMVEVGNIIDIEGIEKYRDLIWSTLLKDFENGVKYWFSPEEERKAIEINKKYLLPKTTVAERVESILYRLEPDSKGRYKIKLSMIDRMLNVAIDRSNGVSFSIRTALKNFGFFPKEIKENGKNNNYWIGDEDASREIAEYQEKVKNGYDFTEDDEESPLQQDLQVPVTGDISFSF